MSTLTLLAEATPLSGPDDSSEAIAAARAGDLAAFERLMRQHERMVLVTALRVLGSLHDAQDVSQEVFVKLYRNLGKVEAGAITGWLYRVTVNACHDLRRRRPASVAMEDAQARKRRVSRARIDVRPGTVSAAHAGSHGGQWATG